MRIGLFTDAYYPIISGVTISVHTLKTELEKLGHEVLVFTHTHPNAKENPLVIRFKGQKLPMKGMEDFQVSKVTSKRIVRVLSYNLDIIHCHTEFTIGRLGRKAAKKGRIPVVHTYHTMYEDYIHFITKTFLKPLRLVSKVYSRSFANSADEVIFPTIKVKNTFDRYGFKKHSHIIPTGIYLERFCHINYTDKELQELRLSLGIEPNDFVLLFLGRISLEKSIDRLVEHFAKLEDTKTIKLLLVGDGPNLEDAKKLANQLGVMNRVISTGMVKPCEVGKYYKISDLFVNFSITETQGLTYIEALASGVPVLAKYDENLEGVIINNLNGLTFRTDDEFVDSFRLLTSNRVRFQEIKNNTTKNMERFSAFTYAKNVEEIYYSLCNK